MRTHLVVSDRHEAVSLVVGNPGSVGAVDWYLQVVGPETVQVGVAVGEKSALQHLVWGRFDARHKS